RIMVTVLYSPTFEKTIRKMKDGRTKERLKAQIKKIVRNPEIGKPMRYSRKQTREVYVPPFRLSYCYNGQKDILIFLALYHKDEQ
ncbi:MAG: type II toxin-antitoxin system RelE/ParE family toxin, partial [Methanoregulaceae archaeon]|nr:type II toxin-antitoxin system RelE/ParE family toxin [Methanoregulaceae archaeon]